MNQECLEGSTKKDILDAIDNNIRCVRLKSNELLRDLAAGRQTVKDMKSSIRELNTYICRMDILRKDIEDISICRLYK